MVAKCTGIIPIIPDLVSASGMKIGAVYKRVYGFTDLRGRPAGMGLRTAEDRRIERNELVGNGANLARLAARGTW